MTTLPAGPEVVGRSALGSPVRRTHDARRGTTTRGATVLEVARVHTYTLVTTYGPALGIAVGGPLGLLIGTALFANVAYGVLAGVFAGFLIGTLADLIMGRPTAR